MCAVLSPLQICPLSGGKFRFSPSPIPCFNSLPVQALLGLLFSFSAYPPVFLSHLSEWRRNQFSLTWGDGRCPRIHSQPAHTPPTGPGTRPAGVVSLPCPQNRTKGRTGPSFGFLTRTSLPLPLKGEGLVLAQLEVLRFCWIRPQLAHTSPTGPVWCCAGIIPTCPPKLHTGPYRGMFGFTVVSWCASFAAVPPTGIPSGN